VLELIKSERFQKEYMIYQERISKISNDHIKEKAEMLLKKLVAEVRTIDSQHIEMFTSNRSSSELSESRSKISEARKQLEKLLKDIN
jgi:hypothetical protein